jgi:hypothetical protein
LELRGLRDGEYAASAAIMKEIAWWAQQRAATSAG